MRFTLLLTGLGLAFASSAHELNFAQPITVTKSDKGVFYHLESSGRSSLAVANNGTVAITWEDNRSGTSQSWVAFKGVGAKGFNPPRQVSVDGPTYEPAMAAAGDKFVIGWEHQDHIYIRVYGPTVQGKILPLTSNPSRQLSLVSAGQQVMAVWSEKDATPYHIRIARLHIQGDAIHVETPRDVDCSAGRKEELYPSLALTKTGEVVAWEDRREGVTHIVTAFAPSGQAFAAPKLLNHFNPPPNPALGRGTGAMRVVLSSDGDKDVLAVWLDKRDFVEGYDVYAALSHDGGRTFGADEKAQDSMGNNIPQWHATAAMSRSGHMVAAWDDTRDGNPDVWYSVRESVWGDDLNWPGGNGEGAQTQPVMVFKDDTLHAAWLEQRGATQAIRYLKAGLE